MSHAGFGQTGYDIIIVQMSTTLRSLPKTTTSNILQICSTCDSAYSLAKHDAHLDIYDFFATS